MTSISKRFIFGTGTPFGHFVIGEDHIPYFVKTDCLLAEEQKIKYEYGFFNIDGTVIARLR